MLDDLTPEELTMLGHCLRLVPGNAVLTGRSASLLGDGGILFVRQSGHFEGLWTKVALAIREREDMAPFRVIASSPVEDKPTTEGAE